MNRMDRRWVALNITLVGSVLLLAGILVLSVGASPVDAGRQLFDGSLSSRTAVGETLLRFAPMVLVAAGLAPSLRARLYNVGAAGQLGAGALASTMIALHLPGPGALIIVVAATGAAIAGAAWSSIAAELKVRWAANEIISTLALNFVAASLLSYLLSEPLQADNANIAQSEAIPSNANLPILLSGTRANIGIVVALVAAGALFAFDRSGAGYRLKLFGENPRLAKQAGLREATTVRGTMAVAGAAAGLAGWIQVLGVDGRMYATVAEPVGFNGFFLALLAGLSGAVIIVLGAGLAAILRGAESLQLGVNLSPEITSAIVGLLLVAFVVRARAQELKSGVR